MHRLLLSFTLFLFCSSLAYSQDEGYDEKAILLQFGVSGGAMNCITDLGGNSFTFKTVKPAGGFYVGAMYQRVIGARIELTWGRVAASDADAKEEGVRNRNLSFASDISEISFLAELHPLNLSPNFHFPLSPYLVAGVGSFSFNPYTKYKGATLFLQPLYTEGQGFAETGRPEYKLSQMMVPAGGGLSYQITPLLTVKGELIYRFLNTDYLDDVSTTYIDPSLFDAHLSAPLAAAAKKIYFRGNEANPNVVVPVGANRGSAAKDGYYSVNIKLELNF